MYANQSPLCLKCECKSVEFAIPMRGPMKVESEQVCSHSLPGFPNRARCERYRPYRVAATVTELKPRAAELSPQSRGPEYAQPGEFSNQREFPQLREFPAHREFPLQQVEFNAPAINARAEMSYRGGLHAGSSDARSIMDATNRNDRFDGMK